MNIQQACQSPSSSALLCATDRGLFGVQYFFVNLVNGGWLWKTNIFIFLKIFSLNCFILGLI